jgi:hypothetical protein
LEHQYLMKICWFQYGELLLSQDLKESYAE